MATTYRYIPAVGSHIKMAQLSDYTSRDMTPWARLLVEDVRLDLTNMELGVQILNGNEPTGRRTNIPLSAVETPLGWKERYTIHVEPSKLVDVLGWLKRGIAVRPCLDLSNAGACIFQPADNCDTPHWAYTEIADIVPADQTRDRIEIKTFERKYDASVMRPCKYCIDGKRTRENNPAMASWEENIRRCPRCNLVMGFSFDEPHHDAIMKHQYSSEWVETAADLNPDSSCPEVHPAGWCFVCKGTGMAQRYISEFDKKGGKKSERSQAIAELEADGWKVSYTRHGGGMWIQERERTVKRFGSDAVEVLG